MSDITTREEMIRACYDCIDDSLTTGEASIPLEVGMMLIDEIDSLRDKIERFGNTNKPSEFDWNVLHRIDELEALLEEKETDDDILA